MNLKNKKIKNKKIKNKKIKNKNFILFNRYTLNNRLDPDYLHGLFYLVQ